MEVAPNVFRFRDTCNVYVLRSGSEATLIDFGSGAVLDRLAELGVEGVTDVLVTHHHRDQLQGLGRAVDAGARIWVPPVEIDLIADVDGHWQARQLDNDYDLRQDRFSLLESVPVTGVVAEYRSGRYGNFDIYTLPTPGHTTGSVTYLVEVDGRQLAFSGDLLYGQGKVWSLAATQWSYSDAFEGAAGTHVSCGVLARHRPHVVLPSHGEPIEDPPTALALTRARLQELVDLRRETPWDLDAWLRRPWEQLSPHLLRNRTSLATTYALLSETGAALLIDYGYDLTTGTPPPTERAARRPLLTSLDALRDDFGIQRIEVAVATHYHDDHVGGMNLLRDVEGTEVWAAENVAPILEDPVRYDLPCLWYDPIRVDRTLAHGRPASWREYELTAHPLPGHTLYAAAIAFEVDGRRVLATGDQQASEGDRNIPNFYYRNRFRIDDYVETAELYRALRPDLIVSGHWPPKDVTEVYLDQLDADGRRVAELHRELLPLDDVDLGAEGFGARIEPYRSTLTAGESADFEVAVRNPFGRPEVATVSFVVPQGWSVEPDQQEVHLEAHAETTVGFRLTPTGRRVRRARVAVDLTVGGIRLGQQAEALVTVS
jgi:glyoxylase-like metal-dependent hydrolase (beta-lactamase superfamily II)